MTSSIYKDRIIHNKKRTNKKASSVEFILDSWQLKPRCSNLHDRMVI